MKRLKFLLLLVALLTFSTSVYAQSCQIGEPASLAARIGTQKLPAKAAAPNSCCVEVVNIYSGASDCFCTCPGEIENTRWGSLVCQVGGHTYFDPASDVVHSLVEECGAGELELDILFEHELR